MASNPRILEQRIDDERAWTASRLNASRPWIQSMPGALWALVDPVIDDWRRTRAPVTNTRLSPEQARRGWEVLRDVVRTLESGCGFVLLDRIPLDRFTFDEATLVYWLIGQMIGKPIVQNVKGTLLYDVRDVGADYTQGARFSVTNARSSFHTDGAFQPRMADTIALLCLRTARSGGESQMASAYSLHNVLAQRHRELLATLYGPCHFDRRGEIHEGESPTSTQPVFRWDGRELTMRYLNYYILEGHQKAGIALSPTQVEAIAAVERHLDDPELFVEFSIEPGQMLFSNNHWTLHNRNAFQDHEDPEQRRHYVRLWLERETGPG